jgi:hypothetical protein
MANCGCTIAWSRVANSARLRSSNCARETLLADVFGAWGCEAALRRGLAGKHDHYVLNEIEHWVVAKCGLIAIPLVPHGG